EAMGRIMPEVSEEQAQGVVEHLKDRGIEVLLNTIAGRRHGRRHEARGHALQGGGGDLRGGHPRVVRRRGGQLRNAVERNERLSQSEIRIVLVEAMGRIMPEVSEEQAQGVVEHLKDRGIEVLLNT
ncbi:hypothetical protein, partial [Staphylococcus aureus]|uniref:hypothetical protein n=1 Tax=Staphylococcus aureus TaxID=1280 RepID=UPI001C82B94B